MATKTKEFKNTASVLKALGGRPSYTALINLGDKAFNEFPAAAAAFETGALWSATAYVARDLHMVQSEIKGAAFSCPEYVERATNMIKAYKTLLQERREKSIADAETLREGTQWAKGVGYGVDYEDSSPSGESAVDCEYAGLQRARKFGVLSRVVELCMKALAKYPASHAAHPFLRSGMLATMKDSAFIPAGLAILREAVDDEKLKGDEIAVRGAMSFMHVLHMSSKLTWLSAALMEHKTGILHALKHCKLAVSFIEVVEGEEGQLEEWTRHFKTLKAKVEKMQEAMVEYFKVPRKTSTASSEEDSIGSLEVKEDEEVKSDSAEASYERAMEKYLLRKVAGIENFKYATHADADKALSREALVRIGKELRNMKRALPLNFGSSVFLTYDAKKPNKMRAAITGPEGTPYDSGFFLFDVLCGPTYPDAPPQCNIITTGGGSVTFNPNLYACGKVCLSLLGTWSGSTEEMWTARSSLLQLFVSIQALILVPEPYRNEPGYEDGEKETVLTSSYCGIQTLRVETIKWAMVDQLKNPPKGYEEVVVDHFRLKKDHILKVVEQWLEEANVKPEYSVHATALKTCVEELKIELAKLDGNTAEGATDK